jgi:hypothetical protein
VTTLAFSGKKVTGAGAGVDDSGLYDDTTVFNEFLDMRAGVGIPDLSLLSRVEPDFALANTGDGCGESLLRTKVDQSGVLNFDDLCVCLSDVSHSIYNTGYRR